MYLLRIPRSSSSGPRHQRARSIEFGRAPGIYARFRARCILPYLPTQGIPVTAGILQYPINNNNNTIAAQRLEGRKDWYGEGREFHNTRQSSVFRLLVDWSVCASRGTFLGCIQSTPCAGSIELRYPRLCMPRRGSPSSCLHLGLHSLNPL